MRKWGNTQRGRVRSRLQGCEKGLAFGGEPVFLEAAGGFTGNRHFNQFCFDQSFDLFVDDSGTDNLCG